jgi:excisionase family DNA binding protein
MKAYLNAGEIANLLKKEKTTIIRWIKSGKFGLISKVGNGYQVPHVKFKKWWDKNMRDTFPK